ncbi:calcineurin-like phosphoesterase family protein [Jannaschia sp.]|nr:calcineurin-like phosphoesterase family protein [Jannaschia sp.]
MRRSLLLTSVLVTLPVILHAADIDYVGTVEAVGKGGGQTATGTVFLDANRNARLDTGETGLEGIMVSNGREVALTGADGTYSLPAYSDMNLFVTKPAGYAAPVDADLVPQFNYIHKEGGSPDLRFGGIAPTGPLPDAVNFPLVEDESDRADFECLVFGDAQPYFNMQISYVRDTAGNMLARRDNSNTECLLFEGDVMGDDLSLYPRFKRIIAVGGVPQYFVAGNHDLDFDAATDQHSFDTFRREWGPEYYSFDIGNVHFVVLDNVRYPCNGVDDHAFCDPAASPTYNGVIHDRQLDWLANDLAQVPEDKLIVLNAHIPFQTFTDNTAAKHQTDNLAALVEILGDRPALGLSGHTHTVENILPGESFDGWEQNTGLAEAPFHQIVTGALSGSWWAGRMGDNGVPESLQRLGAPRGYWRLSFDGSDYVETYLTFTGEEADQMHAAFSTPRFREWAGSILGFLDLYGDGDRAGVVPPVTRNDLGDPGMVTRADLQDGTWLAVNVWAGEADTDVTVSINGGAPFEATRTQAGEGEAKARGADHADPFALARQGTDTRRALVSFADGELSDGYEMFQGRAVQGMPGPLDSWLLTTASSHLWRADLPTDLPEGMHVASIVATDHHGREYSHEITFEVVEEIPQMSWQSQFWDDE